MEILKYMKNRALVAPILASLAAQWPQRAEQTQKVWSGQV